MKLPEVTLVPVLPEMNVLIKEEAEVETVPLDLEFVVCFRNLIFLK